MLQIYCGGPYAARRACRQRKADDFDEGLAMAFKVERELADSRSLGDSNAE
jgi:hypothetical protein